LKLNSNENCPKSSKIALNEITYNNFKNNMELPRIVESNLG
jgi:hypothetical protein